MGLCNVCELLLMPIVILITKKLQIMPESLATEHEYPLPQSLNTTDAIAAAAAAAAAATTAAAAARSITSTRLPLSMKLLEVVHVFGEHWRR